MIVDILTAVGSLLTVINTLSPLAALICLIGVLYVQLWKQPTKTELNLVKENHLHELPTIAANTTLMVESLRRIEVSQAAAFAELNAKVDRF